jgi:hypothetical protein
MVRGRPSKQKDAREWLEKYIQNTPKGMRLAKDIQARGALEGFGWKTLKKVKKALGYGSLKREDKWFWFNPFFMDSSQPSLVEETAQKLEQIATDVVTLAQTRAQHAQARARKKQNAKCNNRNVLTQVASVQHTWKTLEQTLDLLRGMATSKPCDPPITDEEIVQIAYEAYGVSMPAPKTSSDIEF